jgi:hypothetical protein
MSSFSAKATLLAFRRHMPWRFENSQGFFFTHSIFSQNVKQ